MTTRRLRDGRAGALLVALAATVLTVTGCSGGQAGAVTPTVTVEGAQRVELRYAGGVVEGGVARIAIPAGSTVELVVASDVADEVHLHGYDRSSFVTAGATTTLRFVADLPGVFEVELEQRGHPLAQLEVS
ncbi:hypothetical protein ACVGVM_01375 [Pseudonocardia bannensis]|uniref:EfeO-type cupredoxin-like domain-containing protein n=1 Tax=Pseudonocardia bannensis TaxID=630973 RepID=A0A848DDH1_9PSEU|nr:hypothetical protein [Pseudonocardia bannensis]NMH90644.1 hypothetical protein [Pseudonocardia bannensis]